MSAVAAARCPRCGRALLADAAEGLCPSCLLLAGAETLTTTSPGGATTVLSATWPSAQWERLEPFTGNCDWGPYRVGKLLGRGGMGEVYEAEQIDSGRRVALKILRGQLTSAVDRARFLREGQLAASVSHPHTVYIFGSDEIDGQPAIAMELVPGGTLKDRVAKDGPLPIAEAVSAVLDIVGGLDAAQSVGILHRDIKPSNCFVDADGAVKVGDFGLSISTLARDVHHELETGVFQGTPQFAPPEQLRGEPLDVRADIYAVGATLYYLLTGQPPFDAPDLRQLVARVTNEPPKSARAFRHDVPADLDAVVLRCLAKTPADRPTSYSGLADALRPFAAQRNEPARMRSRFLAALLDGAIVQAPFILWRAINIQVTMDGSGRQSGAPSWIWLVAFAYALVVEGAWGASAGKRLLGLRVVQTGGGAWWPRIATRTMVFFLPAAIATAVMFFVPVADGTRRVIAPNVMLDTTDLRATLSGLLTLTLTALLFLRARRENGFAGLHELWSGTRVVVRHAEDDARTRAIADTAPLAAGAPMPSGAVRCGPFDVVAEAGRTGSGRLLIGFDPILRRRVWIHAVPAGTAPIDAARRDVGRAGRLHWLSGRRTADADARERLDSRELGDWDAFEAPDGAPWLLRRDTGASWPTLKSWLRDLARELSISEKDSSLPSLNVDRLWMRSDGRLVLLDFPAPSPGAPRDAAPAAPLTPVELLSAVATHAGTSAGTGYTPMPLSAARLLDRWASGDERSIDHAHRDLEAIAALPDAVPRARRAIPIVVSAAPVVLFFVLGLSIGPVLDAIMNPANREMFSWLQLLTDRDPPPQTRVDDPAIRAAVETYVAGRFGDRLTDERFWGSRVMQQPFFEGLGRTAADIAARHPAVSREQMAEASALIRPEIDRRQNRDTPREENFASPKAIVLSAVTSTATLLVLLFSLAGSIVVPGGMMLRLLGLAVVTRDGREITRLRSLARAVIAWSPAIVWLTYLAFAPKVSGFVPAPQFPVEWTVITLALLAAGAAWAIVRPERGAADAATGTWVVSR